MKHVSLALILTASTACGETMPGTFTKNLTALMPEGVTLAPELTESFDWLEAQGWMTIREGGKPEDHWLAIYPAKDENKSGASYVGFGGSTLAFTGHWSLPDPALDARVAEIGVTAGDGGRVAIWLDDAGHQQFVHLGHDTLGIISDDPLVLLQFLAMGYLEPGGLEATNLTPDQYALDYYGVDNIMDLDAEERLVAPTAFQGFLKQRFNLDMPATARDLGIADFAYYGDEASTDPFVQWLIKVTPPPTEAELAYIKELSAMAANMNLDDLELTEDEPKGFIDTLKGWLSPKNY